MTVIAILVLAASLFAVPAAAAEAVVEVSGKQVALPAGPWQVAAESQDVAEGMGRPVLRRLLIQMADGRLIAFALVTANAEPARDGWGLARDCLRDDLHFVATPYRTELDGACAFVNHAAVRRRDLAGWAQPLLAFPDAWPSTWLVVGVRVTDRRDFVDVRYHFSPAAFGYPVDRAASWGGSGWAAERTRGDAGREAVLAGLGDWALLALAAAEEGLRNRLSPGQPLASPHRTAAPPRADPPGAAGALGVVDKSLLKTVTWRVVGTMGDLFTGFALTGSATLSGGLAALGAVVNSALFLGHEMAWEGGGGHAAVLDLPYLGDTGG